MKTQIFTLFFVLLSKSIFGQYSKYETYVTPYLSSPIESGFFYFNLPNSIQPGSLYSYYKLNAPDNDNEMLLVETHTDELVKLKHYKYQQLFKSIPVEGAGCIEHFNKNGNLVFLNAKFVDSIQSDGRPNLTPEEVVEDLISFINRDGKLKFAWQSEEWEQQIRIDQADSNATWYPTAELIFAVDTVKDMSLVIDGSRYELAYKIAITTILPNYETFFYYVNAMNGNILKVRSTTRNDGPAGVYGYGNQIIDSQWKGGFTQAFILETNDNSRRIHTKKNPAGNTPWFMLNNTTDDNDNWGATNLTETTTHFHVSNSWDYFKTFFNRNGQDNSNIEVKVRTQLNLPGGGAGFRDKLTHNELIFGKSSGYDWGLEPSIVAHEFTHGVSHHTANFFYEYESGALDESFSDIFGLVIPYFMLDNNTTNWEIGDFIPINATRSLKEPKDYGEHWTGTYDSNGAIMDVGQPDTYLGDFWCEDCPHPVDIGGIHINSGVQNKWFYILANGESDYNDLSNYYSVTGIGISKAAAISYLALTSFLMNSSQFSDSRQATIQSAIELYGECSLEHQSTIDAWYAVGLGDLNNCSFTLDNFEVSADEIKVFPNPTSNILNIQIPLKSEKTIQIYDVSGRLVSEFSNTNTSFTKDVSYLENGVYTISFSIKNNIVSKRFIVQK